MASGIHNLIEPPSDPLLTAIPPNVRDDWRRGPTPELVRRLEILTACGPRPSERLRAIPLMFNRAKRAAWETYVYSAYACGLLDGACGNDMRRRLEGKDEDNFRSAMAECMACWFLAGKLRLPVNGEAPGRDARMLDMGTIVGGLPVGVEVKAPYREMPQETKVWHGHDGDALVQCLEQASKQFDDDRPNLLILAPQLPTPVAHLRVQLVSALYGQEKLTFPVDLRTGASAGPVANKFFPDGSLRLIRFKRTFEGQPWIYRFVANGKPAYTAHCRCGG